MKAALLDLDGALVFLDGDRELRDQLLGTLLRVLDDAMRTLPDLIARGAWADVCDIAHQLAPSLSFFCPAAAEPVTALGVQSRQADPAACRALVARAMPLLQRLRHEVRQQVALLNG